MKAMTRIGDDITKQKNEIEKINTKRNFEKQEKLNLHYMPTRVSHTKARRVLNRAQQTLKMNDNTS